MLNDNGYKTINKLNAECQLLEASLLKCKLNREERKMEKEEACWIFYEDREYYCSNCVRKRVDEINENDEFAKERRGDKCGYYQDTANVDYEVECRNCGTPLYSLVDD